MKSINKISLALGVLALAFTSCENVVEREIAPKETSGVYFLETNVTSHTFLPDSTVAFNVLVGRVNADKQETMKYTIEDEYGVFVLPDSVVFEKGVTVDTIHVTAPTMELGMNAELILTMNDPENISIYGSASVTISVLRDYEWINRGTATFTDSFFGFGTTTCAIQQAKETNLFCLRDPYKGFEDVFLEAFGSSLPSNYTIPTGYSLQFYMDTTNWTIQEISEGEQTIGLENLFGYIAYYYTNGQGGCGFSSNGNVYQINMVYLGIDNGEYAGYVPYSFVWDEANFPNPDLIIDPAEGDGKLELNLDLTNGIEAWYGNRGYTDKYGRPLFSNYYLVLCDSIIGDSIVGSRVVLDLYATPSASPASFEGEYTIGNTMEAGNVLAGYKGANGIMGSYVYYAPSNTVLYLSKGTVKVKDDTDGNINIQVAANNLTGDTINVSYKGKLQIIDATQNYSMSTKSEFVSSLRDVSSSTAWKPITNIKPVANIKF